VTSDCRLGEEGDGFVQVMQGFTTHAHSSACNASQRRKPPSTRPGNMSRNALRLDRHSPNTRAYRFHWPRPRHS
jgi:hypothetical protein